jgi:hypothetical protein
MLTEDDYINCTGILKYLIVNEKHIQIEERDTVIMNGVEVGAYAEREWGKRPPRIVIKESYGGEGTAYAKLAILSHELGHFISGFDHPGHDEAILKWYRARRLQQSKLPVLPKIGRWLQRSANPIMIREERLAWEAGFQFLRDHNMPVCQYMKNWARKSEESFL